MATPKNSSYNELAMEAGRLSIQNGGREVEIVYGPNAGAFDEVRNTAADNNESA